MKIDGPTPQWATLALSFVTLIIPHAFAQSAEGVSATTVASPAAQTASGTAISQDEVSAWISKLQRAGLAAGPSGKAPSPPDNVEDAVRCLSHAAEDGNVWGNVGLGWLYQNGWGVPKDPRSSFENFLKAATAGNVAGEFNVYTGYDQGIGVAQNPTEATAWLRKAADQGYVYAEQVLGYRLANGQGVAQDDVEAAKWYRKSAEQGWVAAEMFLGQCYEDGKGVNKDFSEAAKWYQKAADQGDNFSQFELGVFYSRGLGVERNYAESLRLMHKVADAATIGSETAMLNIGKAYQQGLGVTPDMQEAFKWFQKAANLGSAEAQLILGNLYERGEGVPKDYAESVKWYRSGAVLGDAKSLYNLGEYFRVGVGVSQDYVEAYAFYNIAAAVGYSDAAKMRDAVAETFLKGNSLIEAQKRSRDLKVELDSEGAKAVAAILARRYAAGTQAPSENPPSSQEEPKGSGSGFVVADGYIVTNWHVVDKATRISIITSLGRTSGKIVASDQSNDLAVIRCMDRLPSPLAVRSSRGTKLGTEVFTIGFPDPTLQGFSPKFTRGEISSTAGPADDPRYFQISVPVQPGNSGGALCDPDGNVIGVVAAKLDAQVAFKESGSLPENVNYAVKSSYVLALLESLDLPSKFFASEPTNHVSKDETRQRVQDSSVLIFVY